MNWVESISGAVAYIENHITDDLSPEIVAKEVHLSSFYFQRGFRFLCDCTIMEYIRSRRLALAGIELAAGKGKILDIALKYGYDSPDSFAKAFTRFHGITPSAARKGGITLKSFAPLKIKLILEGGLSMDYRMEKKECFTVMGAASTFSYEEAKEKIPEFWERHYASGGGEHVCGMFGINIDETLGNNEFEYLIADIYNPADYIPEGFTTRTIPALTWAVFPIRGALPDALQDVNEKIFSEWLPALRDYEFAAGYCVEFYDVPGKYPKGTKDEQYYSEIWLPVKEK